MEVAPDPHKVFARRFINYCKDKFGWSDLSKDVIMDVGCGEDGLCGKAILARFPNAAAVIGVDFNMEVLRTFKQTNETKMQWGYADLVKRSSLRNYEGKMTKVVSTQVFHQIQEKEEAFSNVYRLLKPGGEAAILFSIKSGMHKWWTEMLKIPKWKNAYKGNDDRDMFSCEIGADHYKEMVRKIGFHIVDCREEDIEIPYPLDQLSKEDLCKMWGAVFNLPPDLIDEFNQACLQVFAKVCEKDEEGDLLYTSTDLSLLLTKPAEESGSKTKENTGS